MASLHLAEAMRQHTRSTGSRKSWLDAHDTYFQSSSCCGPPSRPSSRAVWLALPANSPPRPVELVLPSWTVAADIDLRTWLLDFGAVIRIESPPQLRQGHQQLLHAARAVHEPA